MRSRLFRALLLALLVGGGFIFYRTTLRPDPQRLEQWAEAALREIFGPDLTHGSVEVDILEGVRIREMRVQGRGDREPTLWADAVEVRHDVLALSAGVLRLQQVVLKGPRISTHETETGEIALDFPFEPPRESGARAGPPPALVVVDGSFRLKAHAQSKMFRPGYELVLERFHGAAIPDDEGTLHIEGAFAPRGVGMEPQEEITFRGTANIEKGVLDVYAVWDKLRLTREVKEILAPDLLARLEGQRLIEGPHQLGVHFARDPRVEAGRLRVMPQFKGTARMDIGVLPGAETIDAKTREQINELFGRINLEVEISGNRIDIRELTTSIAGAQLRATGHIENGGEVVDLDLTVQGLRLDDPAIHKALGPISERVLSEFEVHGTADLAVSLRRAKGGPFEWDAVVDLVDATLVYRGRVDPVLKTPAGRPLRDGFPYAVEHASGRIYVSATSARFDPIEGRHGTARVRLRGSAERARDGGPTGFVRWSGGDTEVVLTVEAHDVPVDRDIEEAVEGSEFAGFLDRYRPSGVIDGFVLDIRKRPVVDEVAVVELDVDIDHEGFVYGPFPLPLEEVKGHVGLRRPVRADGRRGKEFHVRATGRAAGGDVSVEADILASERRGRVKVRAEGVTIDAGVEAAVLASEPGKGGLGEAWRYLRPRGLADVEADLAAYEDPAPETWDVRLRGASVRLGGGEEDTSATVDGLSGSMRVSGSRAEIAGIDGRVGGAPVRVNGVLDGGPSGLWDLYVDVKRVTLTRGLIHVMQEASPCGPIFPPGVTVDPGGTLDLGLHLKRDPLGENCPLQAAVSVRDADIGVHVGDLAMRVTGGFTVDGPDVTIDSVRAEGQGVLLEIPHARIGDAGLTGAVNLRLTDVAVTPELLGLLPASLRTPFADATKDRLLQADALVAEVDDQGGMTVKGVLGLRARPQAPAGGAPRGRLEFAPLTVTPPDAAGRREMRGVVRMTDLDIDVGTRLTELTGSLDLRTLRVGDDPAGEATLAVVRVRVAGLLARDVAIPLDWREGILRAGPVRGSLYGGLLTGQVVAHTKTPVAYEGHLHLEGMALEALRQDLRSTSTVSGRVRADVEFQSRSGGLRDLTAVGTASVRDGDLGDLPPVANLPALFGSLMPSSRRPKFEKADARFAVADEQVRIEHVRLSGPLFDVDGQGTLDFSGNLDALLAPQFIKSMILPGALQIPGIGQLVGLFREDPLYVVRVCGPIADPQSKVVPLPFIGPRSRRAVGDAPPPPPPPPPAAPSPERRVPSGSR